MTVLYQDNDNLFVIDELKDTVAGTFLNAATVNARVLSTSGTEVVANQSMGYVAASNGKYRASVDKAVFAALVVGTQYDVEITAAESGLDYRRLIRVTFAKRRSE